MATALKSTSLTKAPSNASIRELMYEPHRSFQQRTKRRGKQEQKEKPQPKEREKQAPKLEWEPVEDTDYLYDVSDDETNPANLSNVQAKPRSNKSSADAEVNRPGLRGSDLASRLTTGNLKPSAVKSMNKRLENEDADRKIAPIVNLPGREKNVSELSCKPLLRPGDIPDEVHSLRQHPTRNIEGDIIVHAAPTGSNMARDVVPLAIKAREWSIITRARKKTAEVPNRDNNDNTINTETVHETGKQRADFNPGLTLSDYHSADNQSPRPKEKQRAISPLVPKSSDPEDPPSGAEGEPPIYFRGKRTIATRNDDQQLSIKKGEIFQFLNKHVLITDEAKDKSKYLLQRRNDPDHPGWVFAKDVEPVDKSAWRRREKKGRGGGHDL